MQKSTSMLQMLGLAKYAKAFEAEGFETVASIISNEEAACTILKTKHEKDVMRGYLRVRETQTPDTADLTERRAAAFQLVRDTLTKLSALQNRKAAILRDNTKEDIADLLDAIDDAKQNLRLGQQQLEGLSKESQAAAAQQLKSSTQTRKPSTLYRPSSSAGERLQSPRMANERPSTAESLPYERRRAAAPKSSFATSYSTTTTRVDPVSWNRNPVQSRVERLAKAFRPKVRLSAADPNALEVVGAKANQVSLGVEMSRDENAQMCCGATRPTVK